MFGNHYRGAIRLYLWSTKEENLLQESSPLFSCVAPCVQKIKTSSRVGNVGQTYWWHKSEHKSCLKSTPSAETRFYISTFTERIHVEDMCHKPRSLSPPRSRLTHVRRPSSGIAQRRRVASSPPPQSAPERRSQRCSRPSTACSCSSGESRSLTDGYRQSTSTRKFGSLRTAAAWGQLSWCLSDLGLDRWQAHHTTEDFLQKVIRQGEKTSSFVYPQ